MFRDTPAFSSFSSSDLPRVKTFYGETLGLEVTEEEMGLLNVRLPGGGAVMIYPKDDHVPATFTVLNFQVPDIDEVVRQLTEAGVTLERYPGFEQDERGIAWPASPEDGPPIAWFTDPAGNIIAVMQV